MSQILDKLQTVQTRQDLPAFRAGDTVRITVYRGKKKIEVSVTLGEAKQEV